jgi:hypothetical protein
MNVIELEHLTRLIKVPFFLVYLFVVDRKDEASGVSPLVISQSCGHFKSSIGVHYLKKSLETITCTLTRN